MSHSDLKVLRNLMNSSKDRVIWNSCEKRCFEQLVNIEKDFGLEYLCNFKDEVFFEPVRPQEHPFLEP